MYLLFAFLIILLFFFLLLQDMSSLYALGTYIVTYIFLQTPFPSSPAQATHVNV